jgi:hypothetical protein
LIPLPDSKREKKKQMKGLLTLLILTLVTLRVSEGYFFPYSLQKEWSKRSAIRKPAIFPMETVTNNTFNDEDKNGGNFPFQRNKWISVNPTRIVGTSVSALSVYLYGMPMNMWFSLSFLVSLSKAILPVVFVDIFTSAVNRLFNTMTQTLEYRNKLITTSLTSLLFLILFMKNLSFPLKVLYFGSIGLTTLYYWMSLEWENEHPFLTSTAVSFVRGPLFHLAFLFHIKRDELEFGKTVSWLFGERKLSLLEFVSIQPESLLIAGFYFWLVYIQFKTTRTNTWLPYLTKKSFQSSIFQLAILLYLTGNILFFYSFYLYQDKTMIHLGRIVVGFLSMASSYFMYRKSKEINVKNAQEMARIRSFLSNVFYGTYLCLPFLSEQFFISFSPF